MFALDFTFLVLAYVGAGLALMLGLWLYYDERERRVYERERAKSLYRCLKCGRLYSVPRVHRAAACPACGFENSRLKF